MATKEQLAKMAELVQRIKDSTDDAVAFANAHGLEFDFPDPAGIYTVFYGKGHPALDPKKDEYNEQAADYDGWYSSGHGSY